MLSNGFLFYSSVLLLLIGIAFVAVSQYLSRHRERLISTSVSYSLTESLEAEGENKRELERQNMKWPVVLETGGKRRECLTINMCISGAFVSCSPPLDVGERVNIAITIPDDQEIVLECEVVWNNSGIPEDRVVSRGMGVRFLGISNESREKLNRILSKQEEKNRTEHSLPSSLTDNAG